jgi:ribosome-associated protein
MTDREEVRHPQEFIELDQFLKLAQVVSSGGEAKRLIQSGAVTVNGAVETRRGKKLHPGDTVEVNGDQYVIEADPDSTPPEV